MVCWTSTPGSFYDEFDIMGLLAANLTKDNEYYDYIIY
jgi:hypothetical protein